MNCVGAAQDHRGKDVATAVGKKTTVETSSMTDESQTGGWQRTAWSTYGVRGVAISVVSVAVSRYRPPRSSTARHLRTTTASTSRAPRGARTRGEACSRRRRRIATRRTTRRPPATTTRTADRRPWRRRPHAAGARAGGAVVGPADVLCASIVRPSADPDVAELAVERELVEAHVAREGRRLRHHVVARAAVRALHRVGERRSSCALAVALRALERRDVGRPHLRRAEVEQPRRVLRVPREPRVGPPLPPPRRDAQTAGLSISVNSCSASSKWTLVMSAGRCWRSTTRAASGAAPSPPSASTTTAR